MTNRSLLFKLLFLSISIFKSSTLIALEEPNNKILIEDTPIKIGSTSHWLKPETVITSEQLKQTPYINNLSQLLKQKTALSIAGPSAFIRGLSSDNTLVVIDGVPEVDPSSPSGSYDLTQISLSDIEKIEIYSGAQSVYFANGGAGGVIQIYTKSFYSETKAENNLHYKVNLSVPESQFFELGSTLKHNRFSPWSTSLFINSKSQLETSKSNDPNEKKPELDHDLSSEFRAILTWSPKESEQKLILKFQDSTSSNDLDATGGPGGDDPNYSSFESKKKIVLTHSGFYFGDSIYSLFQLNYLISHKEFTNETDLKHIDYYFGDFKFNTINARWAHDFYFEHNQSLKWTLDYQGSEGKYSTNYSGLINNFSNHKLDSSSTALIYKTNFFETHQFSAGLRWADKIPKPVGIVQWHVYLDPETNSKFGLQWSSGYKLPTFYQWTQNKYLKTEYSESKEIFIEKLLFENTILKWTIFENLNSNKINYNFLTSKYLNLDSTKATGNEISIQFQPHTSLETLFQATQTHTNILRVPTNEFKLNLNYKVYDNQSFILDAKYIGKSYDLDPVTYKETSKKSVTLYNLGYSQNLKSDLTLNFNIENIFNSHYEEILGYNSNYQKFLISLTGDY